MKNKEPIKQSGTIEPKETHVTRVHETTLGQRKYRSQMTNGRVLMAWKNAVYDVF